MTSHIWTDREIETSNHPDAVKLRLKRRIAEIDAGTAAGHDLDGSPIGRGYTGEEWKRRQELLTSLSELDKQYPDKF